MRGTKNSKLKHCLHYVFVSYIMKPVTQISLFTTHSARAAGQNRRKTMLSKIRKTVSVLLALIMLFTVFGGVSLTAFAEGSTVQGLYNAKFSKYQLFDVQRSGSVPSGTQTSPGSYTVRYFRDPIKLLYENSRVSFNYAPFFAEDAWCTFVPVGKYSEGCYSGNISAWTQEGANDPVILDLYYHDADGEAVVTRGFIGALGADGFMFIDTSLTNFGGGLGIYVSITNGFDDSHDSINYNILPNGRFVCDPEILENLIVGSMLGNGETRVELCGDPEWTWEDDGSAASAIFRSRESDAAYPVTADISSAYTAGVHTTDAFTVYTATAHFNGTDYVDRKTVYHENTAPGHSWNGGEVAEAATCIAMGKTLYTCTVEGCGETQTLTDIPVNTANHVNTEPTAETFSTCTVPGCTAGVYCTDCRKYVSGHEEKPLAAHTVVLVNAKEATENENGYTGDEVCTVCGQTVKRGETIRATGEVHCPLCGEVHNEKTLTGFLTSYLHLIVFVLKKTVFHMFEYM